MHARMHAQLFATLYEPWTVVCQGALSTGFTQARILDWVAISFSRGSSQPRDQTASLVSPALASRFFTTIPPGEPMPQPVASISCQACQWDSFGLLHLSCVVKFLQLQGRTQAGFSSGAAKNTHQLSYTQTVESWAKKWLQFGASKFWGDLLHYKR